MLRGIDANARKLLYVGFANPTVINLVTSNQLDLSLIAQDDESSNIEMVNSPFTTHYSLKKHKG